MIFVGGPRHAQDIEVTTPPDHLIDPKDPTRGLPQVYIDIASASSYYVKPVVHIGLHPVFRTPQTAYIHIVYVHETLIDRDVPNERAKDQLMEAVAAWWFTTFGRKESIVTEVRDDSDKHQN